MVEVYTDQEFANLLANMQVLEPKSFIFVQTELSPDHIRTLETDKRFFVIVARENGNPDNAFYCICHVDDKLAAIDTVQALITGMGGENITAHLMN
jgi:hypothetical protein